jgi:hypothetical protein
MRKVTCAAVVILGSFVLGSLSTFAQSVNSSPTPTFTKDIAPILQEKCQNCHRPGQIAPMSLLTYQDARPWARDMKRRVLERSMPPWFIDKTVGIQKFSNDMSLTDEEIATIVKWVDGGARQGDPKDMPAAKVWQEDGGWKLAKVFGRQPDLVIDGPDYAVKANYQDQWDRPITDVGLTQPRWVMAVEMRASGREAPKVFHHILAELYQDETNAPSPQVTVAKSDLSPEAGGLLMEWAVGKNYDIYRRDAGKLLMPGAKIRWEYHTHSTDHDVTGHAQLAVYLYPEGQTPKYRTYLAAFETGRTGPDGVQVLDIAPNTVEESEGFHVLRAPARLENFQPHMHLRGKAMSMEAILPDGTTQMLSYVGNFNFNWMTNYIYSDDDAPVLPKGTVIHVKAWHDNTNDNPNNPDPGAWVGYGDRTVDEMAHAWVNVTYIGEDDYKAWAAAHKQSKGE